MIETGTVLSYILSLTYQDSEVIRDVETVVLTIASAPRPIS